MQTTDLEVTTRAVSHLPIIRAVIDALGIAEVIDERCPKHALNRVSDADCVIALILKTMCGSPSLYRLPDWLRRLDLDVLLGADADPDAFNDTRVAEALDHLDAAGTDTILADIAGAYLANSDGLCAFSVHHDTTSVSLHGAYADDEAEPRPAHGFSKDHRPDLKQLIYGLTLHGAVGIPLVASVNAGNTADSSVARDHLAQLVAMLPAEHEVTFVGDCKLVDARTIGRILRAGLHFVSLVPDNYKCRREFIERAWSEHPDPASWPVLGKKPPKRKGEPSLEYRGVSYTGDFRALLEDDAGEGPASIEELRFVVVYSDALTDRFDAALKPRLERERAALEKTVTRLNKRGFDCEADARAAGDRLAGDALLHALDVQPISAEEAVKRQKAGRPKKGEEREVRTVWRIEMICCADKVRIAEARKRASCFVLVTDWTADLWSDERVLGEYRHQHLVEGHTGFRWLKGPAAVAPVFLKTPERIRAMGLVLILALMVRNYIQGTLRTELRERDETLPHPFTKKPERSLTPEMAFEHFAALQTVAVRLGGAGVRRLPIRLSDIALRILALLALDATTYEPRSPGPPLKSRTRRRRTPGM